MFILSSFSLRLDLRRARGYSPNPSQFVNPSGRVQVSIRVPVTFLRGYKLIKYALLSFCSEYRKYL